MSGGYQEMTTKSNNHLMRLGSAFPKMLSNRRFVDVTLACEGRQIHCHRVVLAAYSSYFEELLEENPAQHPIIILPRDVKFWMIQALVEFIYRGEISVKAETCEDLTKCAELLGIEGLPSAMVSARNYLDPPENQTLEEDAGNVSQRIDQFEIKTEFPEFEDNLDTQMSEETADFTNLQDPLHQASSSINTFNFHNPYTSFHVRRRSSQEKTNAGRRTKMMPFRGPHETLEAFPEAPPADFMTPNTYNREDMWNAVITVKNGMSISKTSRMFGIPKTTLYRIITNYGMKSSMSRKK